MRDKQSIEETTTNLFLINTIVIQFLLDQVDLDNNSTNCTPKIPSITSCVK